MSKALISGYIGFHNSGDEAVLMAIVQDLRAVAAEVDITVLSRRPEETSSSYGVQAVDRFSPAEVWKAVKDCDVLISGGGSLVQDVTSSRSLFYYLGIIWLAKRLGRKVMVYANGVGPVRRPVNRFLTSLVLDQVDLITLRDQSSAAELERLGVKHPRMLVTADPVFGLRPASPERADAVLSAEGLAGPGAGDGPLVGISVRRWDGLERWGPVVAAAADHLVERHGARIVFLPMEFPGDVEVSHWVASRMRHKDAKILGGRYLATEYMALVGRLDLLVGMRLHSLIFAARQHVPLVGLEYDPKVRGVLTDLGQPVAGEVASLNTKALVAAADAALEQHSESRQALLGRLEELERLARDNATLASELFPGN